MPLLAVTFLESFIALSRNCLFRALGDQLEGHSRNHYKHRQDVVNYMIDHRKDFEPFVEDDMTFDENGTISEVKLLCTVFCFCVFIWGKCLYSIGVYCWSLILR